MTKFIELHRIRDGGPIVINVDSIVSFFTETDKASPPHIECTGVTLNDRFWQRVRVSETYDQIKELLSHVNDTDLNFY